MRTWVRSLALLSRLKIQHCPELCIGYRCGLDPALLWLWHRPVAAALIRPLTWEPPYAAGAAQEKAKRQKKKKKEKKKKEKHLNKKCNKEYLWRLSGNQPD